MFGQKAKITKRPKQRRFLSGLERLENRNLLSGSPWQNPLACNDLDDDGSVSAADALVAINALNAGGAGELAGKMTAPTLAGGSKSFLDADGDGSLSPADPLSVINALNSGKPNAAATDEAPPADEQPDAIGPDVPELTLTDGFARVRSMLNTAGDVDVFRVTAATTSLNVALFSREGGITVSVVDSAGTSLGTASTSADDHKPATVNATVEVGGTYYIVVSGDADVTGGYCLQVIDHGSAFPPPSHPGDGDSSDDGEDDTDEDTKPLPPQPLAPADLFAKLDTDASGGLSLEEFSALVPPKGATQTPEAVFTKFDANADGSLSLDEFLAIAANKPSDDSGDEQPEPGTGIPPTGEPPHGGPSQGGPQQGGPKPGMPPKPSDVFAHLDANSDGSLSATEFATFRLPPGITMAVDELFASWDTDASSLLSLTEFEAGLAGLKKS